MTKEETKAWLERAQKKNASKAASTDTSNLNYITVHDGTHPIRLINALPPLSESDKLPGETGQARIFNTAWIRDDNGKKMFLVLPSAYKDGDSNHPLLDFINKVTSFKYFKVKGTNKSNKVYYYANDDQNSTSVNGHTYTLKSIFSNVFTGGEPSWSKKTSAWFGVERIFINALDRTTGKTGIVAMSLSVSGKPSFFPWFGFQNEFYTIISNCGDPSDYDMLIKYERENESEFPVLHLLNATNLKMQGLLSADVANLVSDAPFNSEGLSVTNFDKLYLTPTKEIARRLGSTIQAFDQLAGTNYYQQLIEYGTAHGEDMSKTNEKAITNEATQPAITSEPAAPKVEPTPVAKPEVVVQPSPVASQTVNVQPTPVASAPTDVRGAPAMTMCFSCGEIYDLNQHDKCPKCGASN